MRFSILIPAHDGEKYLRFAIESVLGQTRKADEIIIADDASTDTTAEISKSYGSKIKYNFNQKATGFVDAWNRGIELASGDFVTILHQDDLLHQDYLNHVEKVTGLYPNVRHIYTGCHYINSQGVTLKNTPRPHSCEPILYTGKQYAQNYFNGLINYNHIHRCPGVTTHRGLLRNDCTYRREAGLIADDDFFLRVGNFTNVVGISQPLASFRVHDNSTTAKLNSLSLQLAKDWIYQTRYYQKKQPLFNESNNHVNLFAVKYINLLLFQSIIDGKIDLKETALTLRNEIDVLIPYFMKKNLPLWGRLLWKLNSSPPPLDSLATIYAKLLHKIIKFLGLVKSIPKNYH
jgi:glycosyltransferase involved in cell wall biosynthesis